MGKFSEKLPKLNLNQLLHRDKKASTTPSASDFQVVSGFDNNPMPETLQTSYIPLGTFRKDTPPPTFTGRRGPFNTLSHRMLAANDPDFDDEETTGLQDDETTTTEDVSTPSNYSIQIAVNGEMVDFSPTDTATPQEPEQEVAEASLEANEPVVDPKLIQQFSQIMEEQNASLNQYSDLDALDNEDAPEFIVSTTTQLPGEFDDTPTSTYTPASFTPKRYGK